MPRCVYINLPSAHARRAAVEASFAAAEPRGWTLHRFEALGPAEVAEVPGELGPGEKGCFASHRAALAQSLEGAEPVFICEDDVVFSRRTFAVVDEMLAAPGGWDVLFTDVGFADASLMLQLARAWQGAMEGGLRGLVNLAHRSYFGAAAYVVRGSAKARLHAALAADQRLDEAYDIRLRDLCFAGQVPMAACFPFVTTISAHAAVTQVKPSTSVLFDETLNAFRRLLYVERDLPAIREVADRLAAQFGDEPSAVAGKLFGLIASPQFPMSK
jgi:GR25 family glycosyltransferase involved in LPS biosynthesis